MNKEIFTENNFKLLKESIEKNRNKLGPLMPILHDAQKIFGAIPIEVQKVISEELNIPMAEIYGVVTFYSQFSLEPNGEYVISICLGTACYVRGAQGLIDRFQRELGVKVGSTTSDGKFTLNATRCVGACGLAPVVSVNEEVFGKVQEKEIPKIMENLNCKCSNDVKITVTKK